MDYNQDKYSYSNNLNDQIELKKSHSKYSNNNRNLLDTDLPIFKNNFTSNNKITEEDEYYSHTKYENEQSIPESTFSNKKFSEKNNNTYKSSFEVTEGTPTNIDNKNSDRFSSHDYSTIKTTNLNNIDYSADSLNNTNLMGYNPTKLNEVSNNNQKIRIIDHKMSNMNNVNSKSPSRKFDEKSINNDFKMLDKLKNKIKDLECKIGEINNGKS